MGQENAKLQSSSSLSLIPTWSIEQTCDFWLNDETPKRKKLTLTVRISDSVDETEPKEQKTTNNDLTASFQIPESWESLDFGPSIINLEIPQLKEAYDAFCELSDEEKGKVWKRACEYMKATQKTFEDPIFSEEQITTPRSQDVMEENCVVVPHKRIAQNNIQLHLPARYNKNQTVVKNYRWHLVFFFFPFGSRQNENLQDFLTESAPYEPKVKIRAPTIQEILLLVTAEYKAYLDELKEKKAKHQEELRSLVF